MILASNSPRRKEILEGIGFNLEIIAPKIDERSDKNSIIEKTLDISHKKVLAVAGSYMDKYVVGADTVVVYNDNIIGKPKDKDDALKTLRLLSGHEHKVITAYSFINLTKGIDLSGYDVTKVLFRKLSDELIHWYISTNEPFDKAGSYGIQGKGSVLIDNIQGDYYNVMGFPISHFIKDLEGLGIKINDIENI